MATSAAVVGQRRRAQRCPSSATATAVTISAAVVAPLVPARRSRPPAASATACRTSAPASAPIATVADARAARRGGRADKASWPTVLIARQYTTGTRVFHLIAGITGQGVLEYAVAARPRGRRRARPEPPAVLLPPHRRTPR